MTSLGGILIANWIPSWVRIVVIAVAVIIALSGALNWHSFLLPHRAKAVPQSVLGKGPILGPWQFGFELGTGMRTHLTSNLPYVVLASCLMSTDSASAICGLGFGIARALMPWFRMVSNNVVAWEADWIRYSSTILVSTSVITGSVSLYLAS